MFVHRAVPFSAFLTIALLTGCGGGGGSSEDMDAGPREDASEHDTGMVHADAGNHDDAGEDIDSGGNDPDASVDAGDPWVLPPSTPYDFSYLGEFPQPPIPAEGMTVVEVELGRHLFYDRRLSGNETQSCADCHAQSRAFTDARATALGSTGEMHFRNSMGLTNIAYVTQLTWANPEMHTLEAQALGPMFGTTPVELGLADEAQLVDRLREEPRYQAMFPAAFPDDKDPFTLARITQAIAAFERTIISYRSPYDRYVYERDDTALSDEAYRGLQVFLGQTTQCARCHGGTNFMSFQELPVGYHNIGLYDVDGEGAYPAVDTGVHRITEAPEDMGKFRAPTLRNIALSAPYMHDGSVETLEQVIDIYAAGGRNIESGPNAGDGRMNPHKSELIRAFPLTGTQRADLMAFMNSLTDEEFLRDPKLANPWPQH